MSMSSSKPTTFLMRVDAQWMTFWLGCQRPAWCRPSGVHVRDSMLLSHSCSGILSSWKTCVLELWSMPPAKMRIRHFLGSAAKKLGLLPINGWPWDQRLDEPNTSARCVVDGWVLLGTVLCMSARDVRVSWQAQRYTFLEWVFTFEPVAETRPAETRSCRSNMSLLTPWLKLFHSTLQERRQLGALSKSSPTHSPGR